MYLSKVKPCRRRRPIRCLYDSAATWLRTPPASADLPAAFVVGSERSGTTMVGELLKRHPAVHCTVERDPLFTFVYNASMQVARIRTNTSEAERLFRRYCVQAWFPAIEDCHSWRCKCCEDSLARMDAATASCRSGKDIQLFVDKSHPLVLFPDVALHAFPQAKFIWIYRDGRDALVSMLRHRGVRVTMDYARKVLVPDNLPNPWAGVNSQEEVDPWFELSFAAKCAKRWASWTDAGRRWKSEMPGRVHAVRYEDLVAEPGRCLRELVEFLQLAPSTEFDAAADTVVDRSVGRWRSHLIRDELDDFATYAGAVQKLLGYDD